MFYGIVTLFNVCLLLIVFILQYTLFSFSSFSFRMPRKSSRVKRPSAAILEAAPLARRRCTSSGVPHTTTSTATISIQKVSQSVLASLQSSNAASSANVNSLNESISIIFV